MVVHGLRGRASNRKLSDKTQRQALAILKQPDWHDFGPTFAGRTVGQAAPDPGRQRDPARWMIEAGLWKSKRANVEEVHCLAAAAKRLRRIGAVGHVRSRLAGRAEAGALPGADDRRCHQLELGTLRGARCDAAEHGRAVGVPGEERADGGCIHGSRLDVHGAAAARRERGQQRAKPTG